MYLPRPNFSNDASPAEIKRYLVMFVEELEKKLTEIEEKMNGNENVRDL